MYYRLGPGHILIPCSMQESARAFATTAERIVAKTCPAEGIEVSTIFLGMDHAWRGPPMLFETMVFDDYEDHLQWRWSTWDEAMQGHHSVCALIQARIAILKITTEGTIR